MPKRSQKRVITETAPSASEPPEGAEAAPEVTVEPKPRVVKICKEPGCDVKSVGRGYCNRHYSKHWAKGEFEIRETKVQLCMVTMYLSREQLVKMTRLLVHRRNTNPAFKKYKRAALYRDMIDFYFKHLRAPEAAAVAVPLPVGPVGEVGSENEASDTED